MLSFSGKCLWNTFHGVRELQRGSPLKEGLGGEGGAGREVTWPTFLFLFFLFLPYIYFLIYIYMYFFSKLVCNFFKTLACVAGGIVGFRAHKQKRLCRDSERRSREWLGEEKLTPPLFSPFSPPPPPSLLFFPLPSFSLVRAFKMAAGRS